MFQKYLFTQRLILAKEFLLEFLYKYSGNYVLQKISYSLVLFIFIVVESYYLFNAYQTDLRNASQHKMGAEVTK